MQWEIINVSPSLGGFVEWEGGLWHSLFNYVLPCGSGNPEYRISKLGTWQISHWVRWSRSRMARWPTSCGNKSCLQLDLGRYWVIIKLFCGMIRWEIPPTYLLHSHINRGAFVLKWNLLFVMFLFFQLLNLYYHSDTPNDLLGWKAFILCLILSVFYYWGKGNIWKWEEKGTSV